MSREAWKIYYRMLRIHRREQSKAWADMLVFGTGFLRVGPDLLTDVNHVLPQSVFINDLAKS